MEKKIYSLKDFAFIDDKDMYETADSFQNFIDQMDFKKQRIYGIQSFNGIGPHMKIMDNYSNETKEAISFVGNDYLGLSRHPFTVQAGIQALEKYGTGACAAPMLGGYLNIHYELEQKIAAFNTCEDALIYSSGFGANFGTLQALLKKTDIALIDMFVHASVIDGLINTNIKMLKHNDLDYLEFALKSAKDSYKTKLVIVDGVYSQDGDLAPLPGILEICRKHGAYLMIDDAHGIGVFGKSGRGVVEHFGLEGQIDIITGTFSKSFGAVGGFVASSKKLIQYLKYYSRTSTYSAAITPQATASVLKAIDLIDLETERRSKIWNNVNYLKNRLTQLGFDFGHTESPIFPIMIRDDFKVKEASKIFMDNNIFTIPIIYPGVKSKESRLRVSLSANHTIMDLDRFIEVLCLVDNQIHIRQIELSN